MRVFQKNYQVIRLAVLFGLVGNIMGLPSSPAVSLAAGCNNEAIRERQGTTHLAQCRAYEMVSPPYKEGYSIYPSSLAPNGNKAILFSLASLGAVGAGESPNEGDLYLATRSQSGWQIGAMNAPLSRFVGQVPVASEANAGETLWEQHQLSQSAFTRGLYARTLDGEYRFIGQMSVPFTKEEGQEADYMYLENSVYANEPVAATSDYRHVIVRSVETANHLKFDETIGPISSYEYSGTDDPPVLIGVEGEKGSDHLVSVCGTILGSSQTTAGLGSTYNALSADGESAFFTAEPQSACGGRGPVTAEIYARLHGSSLSPLAAKTVNVSASECTETCGGVSSKNFEGASENGSVVYFTSTQKLTNSAVDGITSGEAYKGSGCSGTIQGQGGCSLYVYDFSDPSAACQQAQHCLKLVADGEVLGVAGIAEDGRRIYYVKRNGEGLPDLYVYDLVTETSMLVAHLSFTGEEESTIWQKEYAKPVEVTGEDGRFLLFASATPHLTPDDESSTVQLFEYDAVTGELERVTKGEDGYNNNGSGVNRGVPSESIANLAEQLGRLRDFKADVYQLNISSDGRTVVFRTRGKLSPFATSAEKCFSVYEFHTEGALSAGEVSLLSDGQDTQMSGARCGALSYGLVMDASGDDVLFSEADPLVASDVDGGQRDLYDARVGGGFERELMGACVGEGCVSPGASGRTVFSPEDSEVQAPEAAGVKSVLVGSSGVGGSRAKPKLKSKAGQRRLSRALRACRGKRPRARRVACEHAARKRGGVR